MSEIINPSASSSFFFLKGGVGGSDWKVLLSSHFFSLPLAFLFYRLDIFLLLLIFQPPLLLLKGGKEEFIKSPRKEKKKKNSGCLLHTHTDI
jgi:hypothetical protein